MLKGTMDSQDQCDGPRTMMKLIIALDPGHKAESTTTASLFIIVSSDVVAYPVSGEQV